MSRWETSKSLAGERKDCIDIATQLGYPSETIARLETATTIPELFRIMHTAREKK